MSIENPQQNPPLRGNPQRVHSLLQHWQQEGLIDQNTAQTICNRYPLRKANSAVPAVGASVLLGSILLGLGVVFGVAAGWFSSLPRSFWPIATLIALALSLLLGLLASACCARRQAAGHSKLSGLFDLLDLFDMLAPLLSFFLIGSFYIALGRSYNLPRDMLGFWQGWFWASLPLLLFHRSFTLLALINLTSTAWLFSGWWDKEPRAIALTLLTVIIVNTIFYVVYYYSKHHRRGQTLLRHWPFRSSRFFAAVAMFTVWLQVFAGLLQILYPAFQLGYEGRDGLIFLVTLLLWLLAFGSIWQYSAKLPANPWQQEYLRHAEPVYYVSWLVIIAQLFIYSSPLWEHLAQSLARALNAPGFFAWLFWGFFATTVILAATPLLYGAVAKKNRIAIWNPATIFNLWALGLMALLAMDSSLWLVAAMFQLAVLLALCALYLRRQGRALFLYQSLLFLWLLQFILLSVQDFPLKAAASLGLGALFLGLSFVLNFFPKIRRNRQRKVEP